MIGDVGAANPDYDECPKDNTRATLAPIHDEHRRQTAMHLAVDLCRSTHGDVVREAAKIESYLKNGAT